MFKYEQEYARKYIDSTLGSPYTVYKNGVIANLVADLGAQSVFDLGGNVSGLMKMEGSLRFQLAKKGITYNGIDLVPEYFSTNFAQTLNVPDKYIYAQSNGTVGDILKLPYKSNSIDMTVCADVIEHIPNPQDALTEMHRVLSPNGKALVVIPSLYKLDAIKVPHIIAGRYSSHENRLLISEWVQMLQDTGFNINMNYSQPLGIASGLLYTSWLDKDYVPTKEGPDSEEVFSEGASLFRKAKSSVGKVDGTIDKHLLQNPQTMEIIRRRFYECDIKGVLELVENAYNMTGATPSKELHDIVQKFDNRSIPIKALSQLRETIMSSNEAITDNAFFGNAALLVLSK